MNRLKQKRDGAPLFSGEGCSKFFPYGKSGAVLFVMVLLVGCYTLKVEEAFKGKFPSHENNKIIHDYCMSCHIHKDFVSSIHVEEMSLDYKRKVFRYATECRVCHFVEKRWYLSDYFRKTRRPPEANQGRYEKFELDYLKYQKDNEESPS